MGIHKLSAFIMFSHTLSHEKSILHVVADISLSLRSPLAQRTPRSPPLKRHIVCSSKSCFINKRHDKNVQDNQAKNPKTKYDTSN
jgi:hypothetical protein